MSGTPLRQTVVITNPQGFHLRPMAAFAELASRFQCNVTVSREDRRVNGKSTLDLMLLAAPPGSELVLEADGPDAAQALEALVLLLQTPTEDGTEQPPLSRQN
jgi:phosphotransferase system HPr (HPr) family protein